MTAAQVSTPKRKLRWFQPTPGKLLTLLLVVEVILLLSNPWFPKGWAVLIAVASVGVFLLLMLFWLSFALLFRRRFQFSIRSLLVLTIAVAVPCSWLAVEIKHKKEVLDAVESLRMDGEIIDIYASSENWFTRLLGQGFFETPTLFFGQKPSENQLERLKGFKIKIIMLEGRISKNEMEAIHKSFPNVSISTFPL